MSSDILRLCCYVFFAAGMTFSCRLPDVYFSNKLSCGPSLSAGTFFMAPAITHQQRWFARMNASSVSSAKAVFTLVPVRVPVPFHSFVLRSHLQKLTGPVPVAGLWRVHTCSGTRPERVRLHTPPQHTRFLIFGLFSSRRATALTASRHRRRRSRIDGQIRLCTMCPNFGH